MTKATLKLSDELINAVTENSVKRITEIANESPFSMGQAVSEVKSNIIHNGGEST